MNDAGERRRTDDGDDTITDGDTISGDDTGRYVYCVVPRDDDAAAAFDADGVAGADLSVVSVESLSAVVHDRAEPYESDAPGEVREWLYDHQAAVEAAGEAFGTPVPFRFDTVVRGDDETIRTWLSANADALTEALADLSGRWEYRVEVEWDRDALAEALADEDEELADLNERLSDASDGTAFLLEKQYERRVSKLAAERRRRRTAELAGTRTDDRPGGGTRRRAADAADRVVVGPDGALRRPRGRGRTRRRRRLPRHDSRRGRRVSPVHGSVAAVHVRPGRVRPDRGRRVRRTVSRDDSGLPRWSLTPQRTTTRSSTSWTSSSKRVPSSTLTSSSAWPTSRSSA
jgi:hypothetical protein